jgi:predicted amidohydrolase YtcJ
MMARTERTTRGTIGPAQRITVEQGLRILTREGAYLSFEESEKGALVAGQLADLAVLTADPRMVSLHEIPEITSCLTMVGGRIVHEDSWR